MSRETKNAPGLNITIHEDPTDVQRQMREDEANGRLLETWNVCSQCHSMWKDKVPTHGVLQRITVCESCIRQNGPRA